jgi:hypothetical protein
VSPSAKEKDLSHKRGGCDVAVEVTGVTFAASSIRLQLRNIGGPSIGNNKSKTCHVSPDEYSLSVTEFDQDQSREQAENAIGYVLQTPEAYLAAYGITLKGCNKTFPCTILASGPLCSEELLWPLRLFPMRYGV